MREGSHCAKVGEESLQPETREKLERWAGQQQHAGRAKSTQAEETTGVRSAG